jgi:curved DNA-binding protein CbpA
MAMDPWQMLGIDATATYEEASSAYRVRLQLRHPDRHHGASQPVLDEAARETRELTEAWELVKVQIRARDHEKLRPIPQSNSQPATNGVGGMNVQDLEVFTKQMAEESVRLLQKALTDQDRLAAHQMGLEVAHLRLELNRAYVDRAMSKGGSIRVSRLREAIELSEKMVIAAESAMSSHGPGAEAQPPEAPDTEHVQ